MPPYRYEPYHNPYAVSIAETLLHRNDPAARAAEVGGQAWAGAAQGIGQAATGLAGAIEQAPDIAQEREARTMQIDAEKRRMAAEQAMDSAFAGAMQPDGTLDQSKLFAHLPGHLVPGVMKSLTDIQKTAAELQESHQKVIKGNLDLAAGLLNGVRESGYDPKTFLQAVKTAGSYQLISPDEQTDLALGAIEQGPEFVKAKTDEYLSKSSEWQKLHNESITANARALTAQTGVERLQAELPKIGLETTRLEQETTGTVPMSPAQQSEAAARDVNVRLRSIEVGLAQKKNQREQAQFDALYTAPGDAGLPDNPVAKAIAEYRIPAPSPRSLATAAGQQLLKQVAAINPEYDAGQFPARSKMRQAFTSGNQAQQLTALNTAIEHLGVLDEFSKALANGSFKPGNELYNRVVTMFGGSAPTNFEFARDIMAGELATAMKKSGATDPEIEKVTRSLSSAGSPAQLQDAIRTVALPMIGGKARVLDEQYHATMGTKDPFSVYTPGAQTVLQRFGGGGQGRTSGGPAVGALVTYQGKQYRVKAIENGQAVLELAK